MAKVKPDDLFNPVCVVGVDSDGNYHVLKIDATGLLQVDATLTTPTGGWANASQQGNILSRLVLIDNLRKALASQDTDKLVVRGEDQLFSYKGQLREVGHSACSNGVNLTLHGSIVPSGEVWVVTAASCYSGVSSAKLRMGWTDNSLGLLLFSVLAPAGSYELSFGVFEFYLEESDKMTFQEITPSGDDNLYWQYCGYKMTKA